MYLTPPPPPLRDFPLEFGNGCGAQKVEHSPYQNVKKVRQCVDSLMQYRRSADRQTDRIGKTISRCAFIAFADAR